MFLPRACVFTGLCGSKSAEHADFERSSVYPNKFDGPAKDGCYVPLKITNSCESWISQSDLCMWLMRPLSKDVSPVIGSGSGPLGWESPFPTLHSGWIKSWTGVIGSDTLTSPLCNGNVADVSFWGLHPQASVKLVFRIGFEYQVNQQSAFVPNLRTSPSYDQVALQTYYAISRELRDAYPASYNDLSKLWGVVKRAFTTVAPILAPALGPIGGPIVAAVSKGVDVVDRYVTRPHPRSQEQSAPQKEREQEIVRSKLAEEQKSQGKVNKSRKKGKAHHASS